MRFKGMLTKPFVVHFASRANVATHYGLPSWILRIGDDKQTLDGFGYGNAQIRLGHVF